MAWDPAGKVAVVTGASSGIGRATVLRLEEAGMTVVAVARRQERLDEVAATRPGLIAHAADVTDMDAVDGLATRVRDELGRCDVLVNNAGVAGGPFEGRADLDDALRTLDVNLLGTVRCTAAFVDLLVASAPSRVVNVASVAGKLGIGPAAYAASKFGMVGFSEALGLSWASRGVTVCQLNPGFITTEGFPQTRFQDSPAAALLGEPTDVAEAILDAIVKGRTERTVPRWYRSLVALRHLAPPLFWAAAARTGRASGRRSGPDAS